MTPGDGQKLRGWLYDARRGCAADVLLYKKPVASATSTNQVGHTLWQWYFWPVPAGVTYTKSMEDDLTIGEGTLRYAFRKQQQGDTSVVSDNFPAWTRRVAVMTDSLAIADALVQLKVLVRRLEDDLAIADSFVLVRQSVRRLEDDLVLADGLLSWSRRLRALTESLVAFDNVLTNALRGRIVEDDLTVADSLTMLLRRVRVLAELLTIADSRVQVFVPGAVQTVGLTRLGIEAAARLSHSQDVRLATQTDNRLGSSQDVRLDFPSDIRLGGS